MSDTIPTPPRLQEFLENQKWFNDHPRFGFTTPTLEDFTKTLLSELAAKDAMLTDYLDTLKAIYAKLGIIEGEVDPKRLVSDTVLDFIQAKDTMIEDLEKKVADTYEAGVQIGAKLAAANHTIEKLEDQLNTAVSGNYRVTDKLIESQATIERLRAALERVADWIDPTLDSHQNLVLLKRDARQALADKS